MDKTVLDLAKDGKISDFADIIKSELKKKLSDNEYVQQKTTELNKYGEITDNVSSINVKYGDFDSKVSSAEPTDDEV